ncbi:SDR family NAD(P)-dependent oxidoreductase, partial [Zhongshania sp.]
LIAEVLRSSLASAKGLIINQSSIASYAPATVYGVTKAALNSLTYGMANVYSEDGIRVNAIAPGIMETAASKQSLSQETYDRVQAMQLSDLHGKAEDIANLAIFLASEEGRFINCEIVNCDAGSRLRGWRA